MVSLLVTAFKQDCGTCLSVNPRPIDVMRMKKCQTSRQNRSEDAAVSVQAKEKEDVDAKVADIPRLEAEVEELSKEKQAQAARLNREILELTTAKVFSRFTPLLVCCFLGEKKSCMLRE